MKARTLSLRLDTIGKIQPLVTQLSAL